jgi:hypothetical protein
VPGPRRRNQHGEWNARVRQLRENGYWVANPFAEARPEELQQPDSEVAIGQMVLEQYLVSVDDGWIFRKAQYYRGALQPEDESKGGRNLLRAMAAETDWRTTRFPLLREAERFFPHGLRLAPVTAMRQLSRELAEADPAFEPLRAKIHVRPEAGDTERVRQLPPRAGKRTWPPTIKSWRTSSRRFFDPATRALKSWRWTPRPCPRRWRDRSAKPPSG